MKKEDIEQKLLADIDKLADVEHQRWANWQSYMHSKGEVLADGSLLLPPDLVARWEKQIKTPYKKLSDDEKESDREQIRQYIPAITGILSS
ncbi:hypothetical protein [Paracoccus sediminilitoris]|uniref:hypothetical protein n=1 Tax=Paracoccus sediminilitoris TaxID=2202419 RepID=UPI0027295006|nr:hypothetical protein [Paracoccus sediminilitoris]